MGLRHNWTGTQQSGTQRDWDIMEWDTIRLEHNTTGTQHNWDSTGLGHNGTGAQQDWDTPMELGHSGSTQGHEAKTDFIKITGKSQCP